MKPSLITKISFPQKGTNADNPYRRAGSSSAGAAVSFFYGIRTRLEYTLSFGAESGIASACTVLR